jgi:hypothetical protein
VVSFKWVRVYREGAKVAKRKKYWLFVTGYWGREDVSGHWVEKEEAAFSSVILNLL